MKHWRQGDYGFTEGVPGPGSRLRGSGTMPAEMIEHDRRQSDWEETRRQIGKLLQRTMLESERRLFLLGADFGFKRASELYIGGEGSPLSDWRRDRRKKPPLPCGRGSDRNAWKAHAKEEEQ